MEHNNDGVTDTVQRSRHRHPIYISIERSVFLKSGRENNFPLPIFDALSVSVVYRYLRLIGRMQRLQHLFPA